MSVLRVALINKGLESFEDVSICHLEYCSRQTGERRGGVEDLYIQSSC